MILQVIVPQNETYDLKVSFPKDYVVKQVCCIFYIEEKAKINAPVSPMQKKKPSNFFGTLSLEDGEKMKDYVIQSRNEWERTI